MHNIFIIAKREYLERVRTRSFVIMTLFIPLLMFGVTVVPTMLANRGSNDIKHMVVVAADRDTAEMIRSRIEQKQEDEKSGRTKGNKLGQERGLPAGHFTVEVSTNTAEEERAALTAKVKAKQLDAFLWATPDAIRARKLDFVTNDVSSFIDNGVLGVTINDALRRQALKNKGLKEDEIEATLDSVEVAPQSPLGKNAPNPQVMFIATLGMVMVMYVTVLLYGVNVMRSILEEKTSRIMEVMLSIASAKDMMAGKILGVGAVGLTQVGIWGLTAGIFSGGALVGTAALIKGVLSAKLLIFFGIFFLLGYVLYSTLCAAVGSMVNSEQEAQQMQFLVMMPMVLSVIFIVNIFQHPSSPVAIFGSLFPFTAPLVMFSRIALDSAPWEQIALSIALMLATIYGMVWLCGRIYRVGILMYGKKPTLPEIMKWIKYA
ncbi:MAG TPA: ABC transporter permease [Candidatus Dormibacteraeota bacterium]|nr:ABC transporter permease [Candidatus Dormibacteraeota bacterium]